jgi:hypothetical protein
MPGYQSSNHVAVSRGFYDQVEVFTKFADYIFRDARSQCLVLDWISPLYLPDAGY